MEDQIKILASFRVDPEGELRLADDGALEITLAAARKIADWVRRYDLRPTTQRQGFSSVGGPARRDRG